MGANVYRRVNSIFRVINQSVDQSPRQSASAERAYIACGNRPVRDADLRLAIFFGSAYSLCITGNGQRAAVAERPVVLPPEQKKGIVVVAGAPSEGAENRRECADMVRRCWFELRETRAATEAAITEPRDLMTQADAIIARSSVPAKRYCSDAEIMRGQPRYAQVRSSSRVKT